MICGKTSFIVSADPEIYEESGWQWYFIYAARYVVYLYLGMQMRIYSIVFMVELLLHHLDIDLPSGFIGTVKLLFQQIKKLAQCYF